MINVNLEQALQQALQNHRAGNLAQAEALYRQILTAEPNQPDALHLLGALAAQVGQTQTAINLIRAAITIRPDVAGYYNDLGNALRDARQGNEAAAAYRHALLLKPDWFVVHNNLGNVLCDLGNLNQGIAEYRAALTFQPEFAGAWANLGKALRDQGNYVESIAALRRALQIQPDYAEAHHNLSLVLLLRGDYAQGWPEHEWRLRLKHLSRAPHDYSQPRWEGSDLAGRTILLHAEQGIGDAIQFVRYLPLVIARGGKVIFACQPALHRLFANVAGIDRIIGMDDPLPNYDLHCPLLSLPLIFTTTIESIPAAVPYLAADPELVQHWSDRLADVKQRKIGIAWAGAAGNSNDRNRSMPPEFLSPLADVAGVQLFSLQKSPTPPPSAPLKMIDHTSELNDFADTAALIANLDLVISVDTAVAHLAGAMGKPAWLLLTHLADWRWHLDRKDSPWYPTARLFRQKSAGDWGGVMQRVATALNALPPRT